MELQLDVVSWGNGCAAHTGVPVTLPDSLPALRIKRVCQRAKGGGRSPGPCIRTIPGPSPVERADAPRIDRAGGVCRRRPCDVETAVSPFAWMVLSQRLLPFQRMPSITIVTAAASLRG